MTHLVSCVLVPVTLISIKLLPCMISEILLYRKILLSLSQLLKLLIIGQVVINSIPLIISITVSCYTALPCENQKCPPSSEVHSAKVAAGMIEGDFVNAVFYSVWFTHHPRPTHVHRCCLQSRGLLAAATYSTDPGPWAACLWSCGCLTLHPSLASSLALPCGCSVCIVQMCN